MKKIIFISLLVLVNCLSVAQQNIFNKEAELQRFVERGGNVEEGAYNIYKLTYGDGTKRVFNINTKTNQNIFVEGIDTTIINIWEIDTTKYADRFSFWQKVQVANTHWRPVFVDDLNKNSLPELYGYSDYSSIPEPSGGPVKIFERNLSGIYEDVFTYDSSTIFIWAMGDIHGIGGKELYARSRLAPNGVVYKSDSVGTLPTKFDFIFYYTPNQINDMTFGDFDNNNITDCAFIEGAGGQMCFVGEYREDINNFETVFEFSTTNQSDFAGFAIDDFDEDGKTELVFGTGHGTVFVIENQEINSYAITWQAQFSTYNAYMRTVTSDIDGNGKPEFWIGGQDFEAGITRFQCYEADGNNSYKVVAVIELRYLVSLFTNYLQASDIDGDGEEELIISLANYLLILKFSGKSNQHSYDIFYVKFGEATQPGAEFFPVSIANLDLDSKKDILLSFYKFQYPTVFGFSYILKQDYTSDIQVYNVNDDKGINLNSFPSPFNSFNTIRFKINENSNAKLRVFNSLGKEIVLLLNKSLSPGEYNIHWDAKDKYGNLLPSGIYLISLQTEKLVKTIKTILLK
jgi:hypothetical protein